MAKILPKTDSSLYISVLVLVHQALCSMEICKTFFTAEGTVSTSSPCLLGNKHGLLCRTGSKAHHVSSKKAAKSVAFLH
jgi:hypothetical protein